MQRPAVSIVIPTFNERQNVRELLPALSAAVAEEAHEIIVVDDDSPDGTAAAARQAGRQLPVKVIDRPVKLGLASAVRNGLARANGTALVVMDGDWSHDPRAVPRLVRPILDGEADLVVGSRLVAGGAIEDWPRHRQVMSWVASLPARRLARVQDPTSGFFAFNRQLLPLALGTTVRGYKILLELLVAARGCRIREVPITFRDRRHGRTKLGLREMARYVTDLRRVRRARPEG